MTGRWLVVAGTAIAFWSGFLADPAPILFYAHVLLTEGCLFIAGGLIVE